MIQSALAHDLWSSTGITLWPTLLSLWPGYWTPHGAHSLIFPHCKCMNKALCVLNEAGLCAQVFLDMVENYPTSLRVLVLAENDISPELQQQICDLLSEGEDDDDREATPLQSGPASSSALLPIRDKYQPIRDKYQPPTWLPHSSKGWTRLLPRPHPKTVPFYPLNWSPKDCKTGSDCTKPVKNQ